MEERTNRTLTFRVAITAAVLAIITALTASLTFIQLETFHAAARAAASAAMDAASANTLSRLEGDISEINSVVHVLSSNPSLTDSDDRSETDGAIALFKAALHELPQADSLYVGYDNGCWLQVRRLDDLDPTERQRLGAPPGAVYNVNLVRPTSGGARPMRRIFEDEQGNKIEQFDLWDYGYDTRTRPWYRDTMQADRALVSSPYASFSIGTPMITVSAPLQRQVRGVVAADLKLDKFSDFVYAQRPGEHGTAIIFDSFGVLIAHPEFTRLVDYAMTHPSHPASKATSTGGMPSSPISRSRRSGRFSWKPAQFVWDKPLLVKPIHQQGQSLSIVPGWDVNIDNPHRRIT